MHFSKLLSVFVTKPKLFQTLSFVLFFIISGSIYITVTNNIEVGFTGEYGRVAKSIVEGNGFSNPSNGETGKTAWTQPVLVFIIALSYYIFGVNTILSFLFLTLIKILMYVFVLRWCYDILKIKDHKSTILFFGIFCFYFLLSPSQNFVYVSDLPIITFIIVAFIHSFNSYYQNKTKNNLVKLGIVLFFAPLIHPGATLSFVIVLILYSLTSVINNIKDNPKHFKIKYLILSKEKGWSLFHMIFLSICLIISVSVWSYRNYKVFDAFIPTKSNMWFEFYLTNIHDNDGQLSNSTLRLYHPNSNENLREEILKEGEYAWLKKYENLSKEWINDNKEQYFSNILTRAFNAFVFIENDMDCITIKQSFNQEDHQKLESLNLIRENAWHCASFKPGQFQSLLENIKLNDKGAILSSWSNSHKAYLKKKYSLFNSFRSISMSFLPFVVIILLFFSGNIRRTVEYKTILIIYFTYLIPNILISHQIRYQRPLFILQTLLLFILIDFILSKYFGKTKPSKS